MSSTENDIDELHMGELENIGTEVVEEKPSIFSKPKVRIVPEPVKTEPQRHSIAPELTRFQFIFKYTKISIIVAIWCVFSAVLLITPERSFDSRFLVVAPQTDRLFPIAKATMKEQLGLGIKGAFASEDAVDSHADAEDQHIYLVVLVQKWYYDGAGAEVERATITKEWKFKMVANDKLNSAPAIRKDFVFDLNEPETPPNHESSKYWLLLRADAEKSFSLQIWFDFNPVNKQLGLIFGSIVLVFLYTLIITEIINRTLASVIAATFAVGILAAFNARPPMSVIISWIDLETMLLLFGMMILVAILSDSGLFDYMAVLAYQLTKGAIWPLINCLCAFVYLLSSLLDNVTMMLLMTPVTIRLAEVTSTNPVPILMCMVIFSNVGAALTPVGDPPNVIITSNQYVHHRNVNFGTFIIHMAPGVILATVQTFAYLRWYYRNIADLQTKESSKVEELRREIHAWQRAAESTTVFSKDEEAVRDTLLNKVDRLKEQLEEELKHEQTRPIREYEETLRNLKAQYPIRSKSLLIKSSVIFSFVVLLFILHSIPHLHHLSMGWSAVLGALLLLAVAQVDDMESILVRIEWSTLLFFASLFILMEALTELGVIEVIGGLVEHLVHGIDMKYRVMVAILIVLWVSGIASAFLSNIAVTTMMLKIIISLSRNPELNLPLHPLVWALAFGACFGGNGTLIGASANVVCAGVVQQHGYRITFMNFFIVGFPVMLGNLLMATIYLLISHVAFQWH